MTPRHKVLLLVSVAIVGLVVLLYLISSAILLNGFAEVEQQNTQRNVERALDALSASLTAIDSKTGDWATWDETYQFVVDGNPEFIRTEPTDASFIQLQIDLMIFVDNSGKIIYGKEFDLDTKQEKAYPPGLASYLAPGSLLLQHPDLTTGHSGIVLLPEGPLLLASRPIVTGEGHGPVHGTLIFGRFLDKEQVDTLAQTTHLKLSVERFDDPSLSADLVAARSALSSTAPIFVNPSSPTDVAGYTILRDIDVKPALLLRAELPRTIYAQAQTSTHYLLASLGLVGFLMFLGARKGLGELQARRETEKRYRAVVEQTSEGIFLFDVRTRTVLEANEAFQSLLGYTAAEIVGRSIDDLLVDPGAGVDGHMPVAAAVTSSELSERQYRRKDGAPVDVEVSSSLIGYDGRQVSCVVVRDITERKRAQQTLQESEERYSLAARGVNDGLWDWNIRSNQVYYSPRCKSMLGCTGDELGSSPDEWLSRVHPDDVARVNAEIAAHLQGLSPHLETEHRVRHKDGSYLWVLSRGLAVRDAGGAAYRMAGSFSDITTRKRAERQILHDALHDALTGLPNRVLFLDRLGRAIERAKRSRNSMFAVLYLDCDRFKSVNDSFGHTTGDHLLVAVAQRLQLGLRSVDTLARLGGDEFVILLEDLQHIQTATQIADRIQSEVGLPFNLDGHLIFMSISLGIVLSMTEYEHPEEVLRDADIAMYRAKALGKARYEIFDSVLRDRTLSHLGLENDLHSAIENEEFQLHYQPIMSLENNRLIGFEALVRWRHPQRGLLAPAEFIPIAEETGLIIPLGKWVLREACWQMRAWQLQFPHEPALAISVNISAKQFAQPDLPDLVARILQETGLEANTLRLEITESVIIEDAVLGSKMLSRLQALGVEVQIDDFGTGYSSLSYLQQFPINTLKIDRSFINHMGIKGNGNGTGSEIVQTIVTLARQLGLKVVAEGVETTEQLDGLKALRCEFGQGYLLSRPLPKEKMEQFLAGLDTSAVLNSLLIETADVSE